MLRTQRFRADFSGLLFADLPDVDVTNIAVRMILGAVAMVSQFEAGCIDKEPVTRWLQPMQEA